MKKFLTVLLVIAVMFTFSFGSAFAAVVGTTLTDEQQAAYDAAVGPSGVILDAKFDAAWAANEDHAVSGANGSAYKITTKAYAGFEAEAKAAVEEALYTAASKGESLDKILNNIIATVDAALADKLALAQFEIDYAKEIAKLDTVDVTAYSTEDYDADYTHQEKAAAIIAKAKADAAALAAEIDSDATLYDCVTTYIAINNIVSGDLEGFAAPDKVLKKVTLDGLFTGAYELTDAKLLKVEDAAADKAVTEAQKAALKAIVAKEVAAYAKAAGTKADSDLIDAYTEMYTVRIDSKYATTESAIAGVEFFAGTKVVDNYDAVQKVVAAAEKYKAERDADGNLVRNAEAIDKIVAKAKKAAYNADQTYAWNGKVDGVDAIEAIEALTVESTAAGLDYAKETAKTLAKNFVDDNSYYPAEQTKADEILAEFNAKVDAAEKTDDITNSVTGLYAKYMDKLEAVKDIDRVNDDLDAKTAYINAKTALVKYVEYYNGTLTTTAEKAAQLDATAIEDVLDEFYGEAGARTEAEMKAMKDQVISLVDKLPTAGAQAEAKKAAQDAIDAIPAVVTLADEAAVQAAVDAVKALNDVYGAELAAKYTTALDSAKAELYNAYRLDLNKKVVAVDKTDKEAVKALIAEFKAAQKKNGESKKGKCLTGVDLRTISAYTTLTKALEDIQDAERAAVKKAIHAIPINVTEADEAVVKAARAAYDAYVAEYTDYEDEKFAGNAAEEFKDCYRELALAEATLGLNAEDPAYSVESLKIKARTDKAKKGSITVRWTVVDGDASAVEGYEIWKSTKHSSGYKKMITKSADSDWYKNTKGLKKGTRYYYKVRAIAYTEDGVKVKSDFSNKARRIAK